MRKLYIISILVLIVFSVDAQINIKNNLYFDNWYSINPAAVAQNRLYYASLNSNIANNGIEGAPKSYRLYLDGPMGENAGIGIRIVNDNRGAFTANNILGSYAYTLLLGSDGDHVVNMGISAGVSLERFDTRNIDADLTDPLLDSETNKKDYFMNEIGFSYSWEGLNVGIVAPYLAQGYGQYIAYSSYRYEVPNVDGFEITPILFYQHQPENVSQFDMTAKFKYKPVWTSFTYRSNGNALLSLGAELKGFRFAYAYEFNNSTSSEVSGAVHEIMLSYKFDIDFKVKEEKEEEPKMEDKIYYRHSRYPGGLKEITLREQLIKHPERVIQSAVKGMLRNNRMRRSLMRNLKIYAGPNHPHDAQKPKPIEEVLNYENN